MNHNNVFPDEAKTVADLLLDVDAAAHGRTGRSGGQSAAGATAGLRRAPRRAAADVGLGRELGVSLSAMTQIADRLERARLVKRVPAATTAASAACN